MIARSVVWCWLVLTLGAGCGGGSGGGNATGTPGQPGPAPLLPAPLATHGHFLGEADVGGATLFVEALVTFDGEGRLHISSFLWDRALLEGGGGPSGRLVAPEQSVQFAGNVAFNQRNGTGIGVILGQMCHTLTPGRFCDAPANAQVTFTAIDDRRMDGELRVLAATGPEIWTLRLTKWSIWYTTRASTEGARVYVEQLAPFAQADDVVINYAQGQLSFENAATGCTGEGRLSPHDDGQFDVFDIVLLIDGCNAPYDGLNGELQGLATVTQSGLWDYDSWLVIFVAGPDGAPPRAALSMRAHARS